MVQRSKRYAKMAAKIKQPAYTIEEAVALLREFSSTKFDQTVEISMHLGVDPRKADQIIRGALSLPSGIGKTVRVIVFAKEEIAKQAAAAGADAAGSDDLAAKIRDQNWTDFDIALATPDMMRVVSPLGKVLGPKGLMPTPKNGTVTNDVLTALKEFKGGKVDFRCDDHGNLHCRMGKLSFTEDQLAANVHAFVNFVRAAKPASVKGIYIRSVTLSATMSPGVPVTV